MGFASISCRSRFAGRDIVATWWYQGSTATTGAGPSEAELSALLAVFTSAVQPHYVAWLPNAVRLQQVVVQGYHADWRREPFLPLIAERDLPGGRTPWPASPVSACILSCRVEPQQLAPRPPGNKRGTLTPVRRGYFSFGPIPNADLGPDGDLNAPSLTLAQYVALRNACMADLSGTGLVGTWEAIRVSKPLPNNPLRGYGLIRDTVWRTAIGTRRSRKTGVGS